MISEERMAEKLEAIHVQQTMPVGLQRSSRNSTTWRRLARIPYMICFALFLLLSPWQSASAASLPSSTDDRAVKFAAEGAANSSGVLRVIEVYPPVRLGQDDKNNDQTSSPKHSTTSACEQTLLTYSFGNSYGAPYVGPYTPPKCQFNRVAWNLTVTAAGRQFDRLGTVSLGAIEVFRTSTAEPTKDGIVWTYIKDVSSFLPLFKKEQTLIFDLGNLINDVYTAAYNVTLTASYYNVDSHFCPADTILPLSRGLTNASSAFTFPSQNVTSSFAIPKNSVKAIFTIAATGQSNEEFWWSNVLQQDINDFPSAGTIPGYSPFREVQLFIDGSLAGVAWPFPIIFTGGVVPGLWRPIVGIDAFDLKEDEIDVTAWLPSLCDGKEHEFSIKVSGLDRAADGTTVLSETVDDYWIVTGKLFIWTDPQIQQTTGSLPKLSFPNPSLLATSQFQNSTNNTVLNYQVNVARQLSVTGTLKTSTGNQAVSWQQSLTYSGQGRYSDGGNLQFNALHISGHDSSSSGYSRQISYPLNATSLFTQMADNQSISAVITRGKEVKTFRDPVFPMGLESYKDVSPGSGALLSTTQQGQATYLANTTAKTSYSFGETDQDLSFSAVSPLSGYGASSATTELYHRSVSAVNGTIVSDKITDQDGTAQPEDSSAASTADLHGYALVGFSNHVPLKGDL